MLRESQRECHDFLITTFGNEYRVVTTTVGIAANLDRNALTGYTRIYRVACRFSNVSKPFRRIDTENGVFDLTPRSWDVSTDLQVKITKVLDDSYLVLVYPTPTSAQVLRVSATLGPGTFSLSTAINGVGYDEYLVLDTMVKLHEMEESDGSTAMAKLERLKNQIENESEPINVGQAQTIQDVRSADAYRFGRY